MITLLIRIILAGINFADYDIVIWHFTRFKNQNYSLNLLVVITSKILSFLASLFPLKFTSQ